MDGRRLRWLVVGGLILGGVGCTRNTNPPGFAPPTPPQQSKSLFGGGQQVAAAPTPGMGPTGGGIPVEAAPPRRPGQKGLLPDTETEFANTHVQVALGDPPPPNKDEMLDMARHRYQRALKQDPKHKGALLGTARMYVKTGEREKAAEAFKKYVDVHPKDAAVHHEAAMACARFQDWTGATRWCEAALQLDPENRAYRKTLGFCQARAGRWDEAFTTMCRVMPEAQARYNMAAVLLHTNNPDACRAQLQLALQADPQHAAARDFIAELDETHPTNPAAAPNPIQTVGGTAP
ncbi:tetratricopeptide repeat protein [bacterium]|nr:tetratricopeptide repeat protein [bacterium]